MKLNKICEELEKIAPTNTALSFDNVGLLVGDTGAEIKNVLIALDLTKEVLNEAIEKKIDLIITHHPLIFSPLKKITNDNIVGEITLELIKNNINYYASHTNLDKSELGTNMLLAKKISLVDYSFVEDDQEILVIGNSSNDLKLSQLMCNIKEQLGIKNIRYVGNEDDKVKKVGICTGAGDSYSLFSFCKKHDVDTLITGDLTYHRMQFAKDIGLNLVDATHFGTENIVCEHLKELLEDRTDDLKIICSTVHDNIFKTV